MTRPSIGPIGGPAAGAGWSGAAFMAVATLLLPAGCIADDPGRSARPPIEAEDAGDQENSAPAEPDVEVADLGFAEDGADPARFDRRGLDVEGGLASAEQSELGPTESTVCLGIEIALDEMGDGALDDEAVSERRAGLEDRASGDGSVDRRLMSALRLSRSRPEASGAALARSMSRCQELGYQR